MKLETRNSKLVGVAVALCCLFLGSTAALADELRLRDGTVIKVDESWERNDEVWYRQGQVIRSIPAAEVMRGTALANTVALTPITPSNPSSGTASAEYSVLGVEAPLR